MRLLQEFEIIIEFAKGSTDVKLQKLSKLPDATVEHLKRLITKGAQIKRGPNDEDIPVEWNNALELVHWAFDTSNVERPSPLMGNGTPWKQYEAIISHAVKMLGRFRGIDGAWRTTVAKNLK